MTPFFISIDELLYIYPPITKPGMLYIGSTQDLHVRISRHNNDQNKFTKNIGPWILLFSQSFQSRAEAIQLEQKLKSWKNKKRILKWIDAQFR